MSIFCLLSQPLHAGLRPKFTRKSVNIWANLSEISKRNLGYLSTKSLPRPIFSPDALLGGYTPAKGIETLAFEWFGLACMMNGILIMLNAANAAVKRHNVLVQLVWLVSLGSTFGGVAWRPESAVDDGRWAVGPVVAHGVFLSCALLAMGEAPAQKAKGA